MSAIRGIDGLTYRDVGAAIGRGGRFVVYPYCISLLVLTFRQTSPVFFVQPGAGTFRQRLPYLIISALFGWWGFPFGVIFTPLALIRTLAGGQNITAEIVGAIVADKPHVAPLFSPTPPATPDQPGWKAAYWAGKDAMAAGDLTRAEAAFRTAASLAPHEPYPRYTIGLCMMRQGRYREAAAAFEYLNAIAPAFKHVETQIRLCDLASAGQLPAGAISHIHALQEMTVFGDEALIRGKQVTAIAPACALGHFYVGKAITAAAPFAAIQAFEECLARDPDATTAIAALCALSRIARQVGDAATAESIRNHVFSRYNGHPHLQRQPVAA